MLDTKPTGFLANLVTGGEMGDLIRDYHWSSSKLGPVSTWSPSLRSALSICLNSNFPIAIYWGPDLVLIYNDAWSPIPGDKHPWALGKPAIEVWPDIWKDIEPQFRKAFTGIPGGSKDALLPMQRHGYTEECYFDFTFTPIYGESGKVEGIFNAVIETTYRVINERRALLLQKLSDAINSVLTPEEVFLKTGKVFENAQADVPFYAVIQFDAEGNYHIKAGTPDFVEEADKWPIREALKGDFILIEDIRQYKSRNASKFWPEAPQQAVIVPMRATDGKISGCVVAGLSARRKFDKDYKGFLESVGTVVAGELNTIKSLDDERQRAEALEQIDKAKTAFFSNISHEFRTPLTLMLGPLQEVIDNSKNLSKEDKENLQTTHRNTLRLQKLVNTLLDFSRIEAGRFDIKLVTVDIGKLTEDLASSFRSAIEHAGIDFRVAVDKAVPRCAIDVDVWEKIVLNLVSNAFKYTRQGSITVSQVLKGDKLLFTVADTGVGIAKNEQEKIFERFYRASNVHGRSQEGTGIGLSMVRELVHLLGGEIELQSETGVGSKFTVSVPFDTTKTHGSHTSNDSAVAAYVEQAESWSKPTPKAAEGFTETRRRSRVLIADDNADMREYLLRLLDNDFEVIAATDGEEAAAIAMQAKPDLIVSDIMMPRLDGFGLLKKLKSNLSTSTIPVIFLSARAGEEAKVEGIEAGADDYLVKPFSARELIARVSNQLAISQTRRHTQRQFYNLFLQAPAHIHVTRGKDHVVEFFHPLGVEVIGKDITGLKIREALPEIAAQGLVDVLDQVYQTGNTIHVPEVKALIPSKDGPPVERVFANSYLPWRDTDGSIIGVLQFSLEITEQSRANQKIRDSESRFRLLTNTIPQFVWIADDKGKLEFLSEQFQKFAGRSVAEGLAGFRDLVHPDEREKIVASWFDALSKGEAWKGEFRLQNVVTKEYRWFLGNTVPLKEGDKVTKWIGSASDIHRQKTINEQLEVLVGERTAELIDLNKVLQRSNEDLQQFAHVTSHDLKEPVRKIKVYGGILKSEFEKYLPVKGADYLSKIQKSINRISAMIEGVLQYSSVEEIGRQFEQVDLNEVVRYIREDLEMLISETRATIKVSTLPAVHGSDTLLTQLFYNLINNALKFRRPDVAPVIEVSASKAAPAELGELDLHGDFYKIVVSDNGIGFDQIHAEKIFESFARLNPKDTFEGTGLGLALCRKIAFRHKGKIRARGERNEGAVFEVYLPLNG